MDGPTDLTGSLLIAMPAMSDPRFYRSLIYLYAHSEDGAFGIIVNKVSNTVKFSDVLDTLGIKTTRRRFPVHFGGPVEMARGFVLHDSPDPEAEEKSGPFGLSASLETLQEVAAGQGPSRALFALGYAGWAPGQLESEIARNDWLTCPAETDLVFDKPIEERWNAALVAMGIDTLLLSSEAGHA
ncbi:YqgE/AlgH family protein [Aestuariibius insulae]|uniref:YqgE/AlgH family protein n=1 Tax=Aestuariibius insulae TaxID=2058287 RepID=UPI00345E3ED6